jgi:thioredoxin 1
VAGLLTEIKGADFDKQIIEGRGPAVVDFWAVWCSPCRALTPILEQVAQEYQGKVSFYKLNIEESPDIAGRYGIRSIPTLLFFKDGKIQDQLVGLVPLQQLKALVGKLA